MKMTNIPIRNFDITKIRADSIICIIGRKTAGKTTLACDILYHKQMIPFGVIISPHIYKVTTPPICILDEYRPGIIDVVLKRQKVAMEKWHKNIRTNGTSPYDPRSFLFIDDYIFDAS